MHPIFKKKSRLMSLVSLTLLAQCCCCILPIGWQVNRSPNNVQAAIERIEHTLNIDLEQVRASILFEK